MARKPPGESADIGVYNRALRGLASDSKADDVQAEIEAALKAGEQAQATSERKNAGATTKSMNPEGSVLRRTRRPDSSPGQRSWTAN